MAHCWKIKIDRTVTHEPSLNLSRLTRPGGAGHESLQQSQHNHGAEVEISCNRDEHARYASDEIGETKNHFCPVACGENPAGQLRQPMEREESSENIVLRLRVPFETVVLIIHLKR